MDNTIIILTGSISTPPSRAPTIRPPQKLSITRLAKTKNGRLKRLSRKAASPLDKTITVTF
jgi:hypothetical protein